MPTTDPASNRSTVDDDNIDNDDEQGMSHDSEYDDDLGVPDSLDVTIISNEPINLAEENEENKQNTQVHIIPFTAVHYPAIKFNSQRYNVFIPGEKIDVKFVDNERSVTTHPLNPNLYTIEFTHGSFVWTVKKRYKHIQNLHNQLKMYRTSLNIPFPTKSHRQRRNSLKNMCQLKVKKKSRSALPRYGIIKIVI